MPPSVQRSVDAAALRFAAGIAAAYTLAGVAWILLSDALVLGISDDPGWLATAQRYKGVLYVLVTGLGLAWLIRAGYARLLRAVDEAHSSELRVHQMFLGHPKPMWVCDPLSGRFVAVNAAALQHYGYSAQEFLAMTRSDLCATVERQASEGTCEREAGLEQHRTKSGQLIHVRITHHTIPYEGSTADLTMADDVTAELLAKHALERQESQFRQLHDSLAEVLWLARADGGEVLYVSPAFRRLYGISPDAFRRMPGVWQEVVHPDDRGIALASQQALDRDGQASCEYRIRRPDGSERWISDRKRLIVDPEGLVRMIGGIGEDITEAKLREAESALAQARLELRVAERTADLQRINAELEAFAHTAAHDLKTPLNGVTGYVQLLDRRYGRSLDPEFTRMTGRITQSARHMAELVNALLALSRVSMTELGLADVDLAVLAREIVDELRRQEPSRQVEFDAPEAMVANADAGLMRSLLGNLLGNAWKYSGQRDQAVIRIVAEPGPARLSFSISDNGAGFDASQPDRLFKPFERFHSLDEFEGTGIGLATCQRIVRRHGGQIEITSAPGQGTTVRVTLPAAAGGSGVQPPR